MPRDSQGRLAPFGFVAIHLILGAFRAFYRSSGIEPLKLRPRMPVFASGAASAVCYAPCHGVRIARVLFYLIHSRLRVHNLLKQKAHFCSRHNRISLEAAAIGQIRGSIGYTFNRDISSIALVSGLNNPGRPSAIFWAIRSIIVDSVYRCSSRPIPHVLNERGERLYPSVANRDSPPSIVPIIREILVRAARFHILPSSIQRMRIFERHSLSPYSLPVTIMPIGVKLNAPR